MDLNLIQNYIYLYHIDKFVIIPTFPESISNNISATFAESTPLSRSAPIYSYTRSGPRTVQISLQLHREIMQDLNYGISDLNVEIDDDYVDTIIKTLQAVALPKYDSGAKMVNPPIVAVRFGNDLFIKGVVQGGITTTLRGPLNINGKYTMVDLSFNVYEVDPYDATSIQTTGLFNKTINTSLERRLYKR